MNDLYHKIATVYKRDPATKFKTLLMGEYATEELAYLANNEWVFTEKVDGTNIRVWWDADAEAVRFGGKTEQSQLPSKLVEHLQDHFALFREWFVENPEVRLYGEGYGSGIQKVGENYSSGQKFVLFDVKVGDWWLRRDDVADVANKLDLPIVPVVGGGTLEEMVEIAMKGFVSGWGVSFQAEGIVARPTVEMFSRAGHRIITKIKTKDFRSQ